MKNLINLLRALMGTDGRVTAIDPVNLALSVAKWVFILLLTLTVTGMLMYLIR